MRLAPVLFVLLSAAHAQQQPDDTASLLAAGNAAYLHGGYEAARQAYLQAWELAQQLPPDDPLRYDALKRLASVRAAAGDFADADNYLQMAINWREHLPILADPKLPEDLLQSVVYSRAMRNYDRALLILDRIITLHRAMSGLPSAPVADDFSRRAQIEMEQKKVPEAINDLKTALDMRTGLKGPLDASLVADLDRLGSAQTAMRAYEEAEAVYRHALVIRESLLGKEDPDLITTIDGLAYACFGQKKYDEADPIYQRLIALWIKSTGPNHPMVAVALDKVAVFYAEQKKYSEAKDATERANAIRTHALAIGLVAAAAEQQAEGNKDDALALYRRAVSVTDVPDPIYDELHAEITKMVAVLAPPDKPAVKKPTKR
jgi:tetratricopeptide (TPR) repeat protein